MNFVDVFVLLKPGWYKRIAPNAYASHNVEVLNNHDWNFNLDWIHFLYALLVHDYLKKFQHMCGYKQT